MIQFDCVSKSFTNLTVLDDFNLTINDNEIFGIVGPSGVGKSTILNCLIGLEKPQSGSIIVDGVHVESLDEKQLREFRKNAGMIFQSFSLLGRKDVFHNISLPMECWGYPKNEIKDRVEELLEVTGMTEKAHSRPAELSGGQKQRVAIARALTMHPKYLLCDEATSALDPRSTASVLELLSSLQQQFDITIIVVTHEMSVVQSLCQRMAIIDKGKASLVGDVQEIFSDRPDQLKELLGDDGQRISISLDIEDFVHVKEYLDAQGTQYKVTG